VSVALAQVPSRTRAFVERGAPKGQRQKEAFAAACQLRDAGTSEADALRLVQVGAAQCDLPSVEARGAVRSAYQHSARQPIDGKGTKGAKPTTRKASRGNAPGGPPAGAKEAARYPYHDEAGTVLFEIVRYQWPDPSAPGGYGKTFRPRQPDGRPNLDGVRRVLYHLPALMAAEEVFVPEGEKDCDNLAALGLTATTNPGGAEKWRTEYSETLRGKRVVILPDADEPGRRHADLVARALHGVAASVKVLAVPDGAKDVSAWLETQPDPAEAAESLAIMAVGTAEWKPPAVDQTAGKSNRLVIISAADILAADYTEAVDLVNDILPANGRAVVSAAAKTGKTWFVLALALALAAGKDALGFRVRQAARVLYFNAELTAKNLQNRLRLLLGAFAVPEAALREHLVFCHERTLKLTGDRHGEAIRTEVAEYKPALVVFDPLYKFNTGSEDKVQDMTRFFDPLDSLIADFGCSVLLVHHHGKSRGEGLATAAHMNRGSSTIADWPDSLLTMTPEDGAEGIVKCTFTLRNAEEPPPAAFRFNPESCWFERLEEYQFSTKGTTVKISAEDVAAAIGPGRQVRHSRLAEELAAKHAVCPRTAKDAIRRAHEAEAVAKDENGLYGVVQGANP